MKKNFLFSSCFVPVSCLRRTKSKFKFTGDWFGYARFVHASTKSTRTSFAVRKSFSFFLIFMWLKNIFASGRHTTTQRQCKIKRTKSFRLGSDQVWAWQNDCQQKKREKKNILKRKRWQFVFRLYFTSRSPHNHVRIDDWLCYGWSQKEKSYQVDEPKMKKPSKRNGEKFQMK